MNKFERSSSSSERHAVDNDARTSLYLKALLASTALVGAQTVCASNELGQSATPPIMVVAAQTNTTPADTDSSATNTGDELLDEIIVRGKSRLLRPLDQTGATGMRMSILETPQAITVLGPAFFEFTSSTDIYDVVQYLPGIERMGTGFGMKGIAIRGQRQTGSGRINGLAADPLDVAQTFDVEAFERVEVVRGPASVVYRTGSFGGEINQILKSPQHEFGSTFAAEVGSYDHVRGTFDITGPLSSSGKLTGRLVLVYQDWGSIYDNPTEVKHDKFLVVPSVSYDFTDRTTATIYGYFQDSNKDPYDGVPMIVRTDGTLAVPDFAWENFYADPNTRIDDADSSFYLLEVNHRFTNDWQSEVQLSFMDTESVQGYSFGFGPGFPAYNVPNGGYEWSMYTYNLETSGELFTFNVSLTGDVEAFGQTHQFFTQFEYQETTEDLVNRLRNYAAIGFANSLLPGQVTNPNLATTSFALGFPSTAATITGFDDGGFVIMNRDQLPTRRLDLQGFESTRGSFQANISLTDNLSVLAGALIEHAEITLNNVIDGLNPGSGARKRTYTETTPRIAISYLFGSESGSYAANAYASYSEGFGANIGIFAGIPFNEVPPELMEQSEVGLKAEFLDGAISASVAWYTQELNNISITNIPPGVVAGSDNVLSGKQDIKGFEFEFFGEILPGWNMAAFAALTDTKHVNFDETQELAGVPDQKFGVQTSYEFLTGALQGLRLGAGVVYTGEYEFFHIANGASFHGDPYTLVNVNISYSFNDKYEIYLKGLNVFEEEYFISQQTHPAFSTQRGQAQTFFFGFKGTY